MPCEDIPHSSKISGRKNIKYPITRIIDQTQAGMVGGSKGDTNYLVSDFMSNPCDWLVLKPYYLFKYEYKLIVNFLLVHICIWHNPKYFRCQHVENLYFLRNIGTISCLMCNTRHQNHVKDFPRTSQRQRLNHCKLHDI